MEPLLIAYLAAIIIGGIVIKVKEDVLAAEKERIVQEKKPYKAKL